MRWGPGGALGLIAVLGLSLLTGPASAVVTRDVEHEVQPRKSDFLPYCETPQAMNCIESIEYQVDGEWRISNVKVGRWIISDDGNGNIEYGDTYYEFETPGLVHEDGRPSVTAALIERDDINGPPYAAYQFQIQSWPQDREVLWDPPVLRCEDGDPNKPGNDPCWRAPWLAETDYRFTFRTSTLKPIFVQSSVVDATTTIEEVPGGLRVAIAGRPGPSQWGGDDAPGEGKDQFWAVTYEWGGFVTDGRAFGGSLASCIGLGITTAYSNGSGGRIPEWNAQTGTLSFGTSGFHYAPDGSVYRGLAEVYVPGPLARCMWKVDPRQVTRMEVEVFGEAGEEVAGTKTIGYDAKSDLVKMIAIDFTYSEKEIAARPKPVTARPGKQACSAGKTMCVTLDRARKSAKVTVAKVSGASEVVAVAMRGSREDRRTKLSAPVRSGKATFTVKLSGAQAKGQVWVLRTPKAFISSFQVG